MLHLNRSGIRPDHGFNPYIMKHLTIFTIIILVSCQQNEKSNSAQIVLTEDQKILLVEKLDSLVANDTKVQQWFGSNIQKLPLHQLESTRDSVFQYNCQVVKNLFSEYGFLGIDQIGEKATHQFMLLVIHCFMDTDFQEKVIQSIHDEVQNRNVDPNDYAILMDKQHIHSGQKQVYGTQIKTLPSMWTVPEPMIDSLDVNERRLAIGLDPLEDYLNGYMKLHFEWNTLVYEKMGIHQPLQYSEH